MVVPNSSSPLTNRANGRAIVENSFDNPFPIRARERSTTFTGRIGGDFPELFYRFNLRSRSRVGLDLQGLASNGDFELLDTQGEVIQRSAQAGTTNESIYRKLDTGVYYVRVFASGAETNYRLSLFRADSVIRRRPLEQEVVDLINLEREKRDLSPLRLNTALGRSARGHSQMMALGDFLSNRGLDGSDPGDRAEAAGYASDRVGENLIGGLPTARSVVNRWMGQDGTRNNILNDRYREIGVGYTFLFRDPGRLVDHHYWVADFGIPG